MTEKLHTRVYKDGSGQYRWTTRADNGEIVAASTEGYRRIEDAVRNLRTVQGDAVGYEVES